MSAKGIEVGMPSRPKGSHATQYLASIRVKFKSYLLTDVMYNVVLQDVKYVLPCIKALVGLNETIIDNENLRWELR